MQNRIVCAAIRKPNGLVIAGVRHWDMVMRNVVESLPQISALDGHGEQGFLDRFGQYHDRESAFIIARDAGQIIKKTGNPDEPILYSEDIY